METITQIALDQLHESPFNPRQIFAGLQDLADSIKSEGRVHEPLLVRPRLPDVCSQSAPEDGFEIVFGHRRYRAAELAGLATVPCMVRAMTNAEARSAQVAENLARADVHPIEEAEGFQAMLDAGDATADELASRFGKSRSYIYGRLKLLQACSHVRMACLMGEIGSEVALLIARLRTDKLQEKALSAIKADNLDLRDGGAKSFRSIRMLLAEKFTLKLADAIFDVDDEMLLPSAGYCGRCPKRTGNAPEYEDLTQDIPNRWGSVKSGSADVCTDPDCFAAKKAAHLAREAAKLEAEGKVVVTGAKARTVLGAHGDVKNGYVALDKVKGLLKKLPKKGSAAAQDLKQPEVVHIQDQRTGKLVKAVKRAELEATGVLKAEDRPADNRQAQQDAANRKRQAEAAKAQAETKRRMALLLHVRQVAAARERDEFDLRLVAAAAFSGVGYDDKDFVAGLHGLKDAHALQVAIDQMSVTQLTALVLDCAIVDNVNVPHYMPSTQPAPLLALAEHYGVDTKAVMAAAGETEASAEAS